MRFLGHRDFMRILLRMLRVAHIEIAMSQGFHPKPKVSFPSALPLGVEGLNEIVELETAIPYTAVELQDSLNACSVNGLRFHSGEVLPDPGPKGRPVSYTWQFPVPTGKRQDIQQNIPRILSGELSCEGKDLRQGVLSLQLITRFSPSDTTVSADGEKCGGDCGVNELNGKELEGEQLDNEDKLIPQSFVRFTVKADETPGSVGYKDCLKVFDLFPQPLEEGPCQGLTPMLSGTRVDCQL